MSTIEQINEQLIAQFESEFGQAIPIAPKSFIRVLAKIMAGVYVMLYKYGNWVLLQMFIRTAFYGDTTVLGRVVNPLVEYGRQNGTGDPIPGTQARLVINVGVTDQVGSLPVNTQLRGDKNGIIYLTVAELLLDSPLVNVEIIAAIDSPGTVGNLLPGDLLTFVQPLGNVNREVTVLSILAVGGEPETEENYRERVLDREQKPPQGGAYSDYELWAESVAGVLNAYPYAGAPGEVNIYIESVSGFNNIPTAPLLNSVSTFVDSVAPVGTLVNVLPIVRSGFAVRVNGLLVGNESETRALINAALIEYFYTREPFISGLSIPPRKDQISIHAVTSVVNDVVTASEGLFTSVEVTGPGGVTVLHILAEGEKAFSNGVNYV